ncbi:MAG: glycosyltransferase [Acidimicrobiales bacterium]
MRRLAILSLHTSPLAQPGTGDSGGMNVYVRELAAAVARSGADCDVFTRAWSPELPPVIEVEPGLRVHHIAAGPLEPIAKESLPEVVPEFTDHVLGVMTSPSGLRLSDEEGGPFEAVHANYWLSGLAGHIIKHELDLPLMCTFHTLDRVKAEAGPEEMQADMPHRRAEAEATIISCSDAVLASCSVEAEQIIQLYGADPDRVRIVPLGVDHAYFAPGDRAQARRALGLPATGPLLLFVGRIQPLKGADVAVRVLGELDRTHPALRPTLVVVGGPSGPRGEESYGELVTVAAELGVADRVRLVPPQPHEVISTYYRAADVCLVPSRSESFGLVALEAAACGTPVVASAVGGLTTLVDHGRTGFLVEQRKLSEFGDYVGRILDDPELASGLSARAASRALRYSWREAAERLGALHEELAAGHLVQC